MKFIYLFSLIFFLACTTAEVEPSAERLPCVEVWKNAQVERDSTAHGGGHTISYRVKNGPNAGYWHSPKDVDLFAYNSHAYYDGRWTRINYSAADRFSSITDISYKERGTTYWRPAKVIEWPDGSRRVERFLNRMRHDNQGPAVVNIDAQGDTTYRACFECDKPVPCP